MGEVWRAYDPTLGRYVAVKLLADSQPSERVVKRFRREAQFAAGLKHPGITVVHDYGEADGAMFIVMELLHGADLASLLEEHPGGLPVERAVDYGLQLADALAYAHGKGIIHRDLKPANLFLENPGRLKICDFGIARDENAAPGERTTETTESAALLGTPAYMAPERWRGERATASSDLYAVGCVLYGMLTGGPPFQARTMHALIEQHLRDVPVPPADLIAAIPPALDELALALLAKDPRQRPARAADVAGALRKVRQDLRRGDGTREDTPDAAGDEENRPRPEPRFPRRRIAIAAVACAALVLAGAVGWRLAVPGKSPKKPPPPAPAYVTNGAVIFDPLFGPVEGAIAAENAAIIAEHPHGYVSVALLTPLTPTGSAGDVSPHRMLDELRAAYLAQRTINANPNAPGIQLLLANEGTTNEGPGNEGLARPAVAQLQALIRAPSNLVAVAGMGISISATQRAAAALARDRLAVFSAVTTGDEFYSGQYANYYQVVPDVREQVSALAQAARIPGKAILYYAPIQDDRYVTDLEDDFQAVFGQRIDRSSIYTNTGDYAYFAQHVCAPSARQVPDILYAGRLSVLGPLIKQLHSQPNCRGKKITIITASDANDLDLSLTKTPPGGGQVTIIYSDIIDRSQIKPAFTALYKHDLAKLDPAHVGLTDPWTVATYNAIVAAGMAIDGTSEPIPNAVSVASQASQITAQYSGNEPDGATGYFAFNESGVPECSGRLNNPDIPVYQDSGGMPPALLHQVVLRQTASTCGAPALSP
jgi:hypothetical protein